MLYFKCPTCRTCLANKQIPFEKGMEEICALSKNEDEKDLMKEKLLDKLQVKRWCCRPRVLCYVDLTEIIK
jgi:DNA-directed RNA polymerase subunit N (RpoN/RPB10)